MKRPPEAKPSTLHLVTLRIRVGELEFTSRMVEAIPVGADPQERAESVAANFYGDRLGDHVEESSSSTTARSPCLSARCSP